MTAILVILAAVVGVVINTGSKGHLSSFTIFRVTKKYEYQS